MKEKEKIKKSNNNFFTETENVFSMRRLLAFIFAVLATVTSILLIVLHFDATWQTILVLIGVPVIAVIFLMTCSTISEATEVIYAFKGVKPNDKTSENIPESKPDPNEL